MFTKIRIRQHEFGLWFRHGDFHAPLHPGLHRLPGSLFGDHVEVIDTLQARFEHELLDVLLSDERVRSELVVADLTAAQRGLVWIDGRLHGLLGPGKSAYWRRGRKVEIEVHEVDETRFEHPRLDVVLGHADAARFLHVVSVEPRHEVLVFREGELVERLEKGTVALWKRATAVTWKAVDLREQVADVAGQEIMTADKVTLRVNLVVSYRVLDARRAVTAVDDFAQALYRQAQLALRAAVGGRSLDALLADKEAVSDEVRGSLEARAKELGLLVRGVGLRDVILPGDMKSILNQVIEAEKAAEANLVRRREETAAARSQANTAKLLAAHPALARMKELEALQAILTGAKASFVFGGADMLEQVRSLLGSSDTDERSN